MKTEQTRHVATCNEAGYNPNGSDIGITFKENILFKCTKLKLYKKCVIISYT